MAVAQSPPLSLSLSSLGARYLAKFVPAMADGEAVSDGERVSRDFVGVVERNQSFGGATGGEVDQQAAGLGHEWHDVA